jgi:hypothetical protein
MDNVVMEENKTGQQKKISWSKLEDCYRGFIRGNHLTSEWDTWRDEWFKTRKITPKSLEYCLIGFIQSKKINQQWDIWRDEWFGKPEKHVKHTVITKQVIRNMLRSGMRFHGRVQWRYGFSGNWTDPVLITEEVITKLLSETELINVNVILKFNLN